MPEAATTRTALPENAEQLLTAAQVKTGVQHLAAQLQPLVDKGECLLLGVLNGGMIPLVWLTEYLQGDYVLGYCHATRYAGAQSGGELTWLRKPDARLEGRTVVLVDDIWDEGITLTAVADYCREQRAATVHTAVLFVKDRPRPPSRANPDLHAGLQVPDRYVFGCGMDLENRWRHLPAVYAFHSEADE